MATELLEKPQSLDVAMPASALTLLPPQPEPVILLEVERPALTEATVDLVPIPIKKERKFLGLSTQRLTAGAGIAAIADLLVRDPALTGIGLLFGAFGIAYPELRKLKGAKWILPLMTAAALGGTTAMAVNLYTQPANALFFTAAETFFNETFALSGGAVTIIFNIFRAIYVVYLIYSAISVWSSYQRDEDWMSVAKAPIVIFIGGTLIDIVTEMIVA